MDGDSKMKSKFLVTFLTCFLLSFSFASGQSSISLESVDGLTSLGNLQTNAPITFNIRVTNDDTKNAGLTNGFSIASPDGATWGSLVGDTLVGMGTSFDLIFAINIFSTGSGADTVGFGGAALFGTGLVANFDEVAYSIQIGPLSDADAGKTIVLDSAFYRTSGTWKWAGPDEFPAWDGPHTFQIGDVAGNTAPVLTAIGAQSVNENDLLTINVSASDADGDALTLTASPLPNGAGFTDNGDGTGVFTWTPGFDQEGSYDVTFAVTDGTDSVNELVTITVNNANQAPVLTAIGAKSVDENVNLNFTVTATDPDGTTPTLSATGLPTGATFVGGTFDWTPDFSQAGSYDVTFSATDGIDTDSEIVTITVNNVDQPPVLDFIGNKTVDEGILLSFDVTASDPDGNSPTIEVVGIPSDLPAGVSFNGITFAWTPGFDQAGSYDFQFSAVSNGLTASETITITVNDVPQAPVLAEIGPKVVTAGDELMFAVTATDIDGTFPTLSATPLPGTATFVDSGNGNGYFLWQTAIADSGTYNVTFSATDGDFTDDEIVTITVGEAPKMIVVDTNNFVSTYTQGEFYADTAKFNVSELNGTTISVDVTTSSTWLSITGSSNFATPHLLEIAIDPTSLSIGNHFDSLILSSSDAVNSKVLYVALTINERPNTLPYIVSPTDSVFMTDECTPLDIHFVTTDDESDPISISMIGLVENMTFLDNGDGTADFNFTPNFAQAGFYSVDIVLFDGIDSAIFPITIDVSECEPGTEGDTVTVATVPAVPGARVTVAVDIANLCDLEDINVSLGWTSSSITLDSVSIVDSRLDVTWLNTIDVNNDSNFVMLSAGWAEVPNFISPGSGNLMNLYFSLEVGTPAGFYPLDFYMEPMFNRDCGSGPEQVRPFFIPGGIVVDTSGNYVCGYVVDPDGNPVPGATVELWDNFPSGSAQEAQDASGNGVFAFDNFTTIPFDLYAYHSGYYPGRVENINFAQSGIMIVLTPITDTIAFPPTNRWVDFYCDANTFKDYPLPVGSVVEAYDPDGVKCGEFNVTTAGEYGFMHTYGDDEFTDFDEGANVGDVIRFYVNGIEAIASGNAVWTADRDINEVCLEVPDVTPHTCMLSAGWNLVSWNVDTDVDDIANVLASIDDCIEVVMGFEQGALTYDASLPQFSDLWSVDHLSAYWIKVSCDIELTVLGTPVPSTTPIPVTAGWNLVSYLPENSMPTATALTTIHDDLIVALGYDNGTGLTYLPGQTEFNDLISMSSCYGYWVKVNTDGTLIYPDGGADSVSGKGLYTQVSSSAGRIDATTSWMNIYAYDLTLDDAKIKAGAEIKAFNTDDKLVGSYVMKQDGKFGFMPIYGDDNQTDYVDGMKSGDDFYLTVDGVETTEQFTWTTSGDKLEIKGLTAKTTSGTIPTSFGLHQNYPNPFNPSTTINFDMPVTGQVKIEIFNLLGQLIATPFDEVAPAGQQSVIWDGQNDNGETVSSGIYFYRLTADNFTDTKKMTLLK